MGFPVHRMRRLRRNETLRSLVRETCVSVDDLIYPMFVVSGSGVRKEIDPLPGNYHLSIDKLTEEARQLRDLGIRAVLLFGVSERKHDDARGAYASDGIVQRAVRALKEAIPDLIVITDVCLCEHTPHGHCGIVRDGYLQNDETLELLAKTALSHAEAGADMLAPAAMMDGQVKTIRAALDEQGYQSTIIMGYSAKFASKLYEPFFKHGTQAEVAFGDKKSHQMDFGNANEAMREIELDLEEGADIVIIKPAMFYLDIVQRARQEFRAPIAVYNVSGEYAMLKAASAMGRVNEPAVLMEILTSFKRAGADLIITYSAKDAARLING